MAKNKVVDYLDSEGVKYTLLKHPAAYTAQEAAASADVSGKRYAKIVMVKVGDGIKMAVLSAVDKVDFKALKKEFGAGKVTLAEEGEFKDLFPDCDTGAMPPFGNLYDVDVIIDQKLTDEETITFPAGTHTQLLQMSCDDFQRLAKPQVGDFALRA
jgi:Ala-tRNA(Pro) deacylase